MAAAFVAAAAAVYEAEAEQATNEAEAVGQSRPPSYCAFG